MSEALRNEQDAREQVAFDGEIRNIQDSVATRLEQERSRSELQHLNNLRMVANEADRFKKEVDQRILEEQAEHKQKMEEIVENAQTEDVENSRKIDVLTSIALNNLEDATSKFNEKNMNLDKEIAEGKAKSMIMETEVGRQIFDEVDNKIDKDELLAQKKKEELMKKRDEIREAEREAASSEREERKENQVMAINDIRGDLVDVQSMGMQNLAIQQCVDDHKNRRQVNGKIAELKNLLADFDGFFGRAAVVLGANEDIFARLSERQIRSTKQYVTRLSEGLSAINVKVGAIEQNLASLELEDVVMSDELRKIKSTVSDFQPVIAGLRRNLEIKIAIEEKNNTVFSNLKNDLFAMINNLQPIAEKRLVITESIQQRQKVSMPIEAISGVSQKLEIKN